MVRRGLCLCGLFRISEKRVQDNRAFRRLAKNEKTNDLNVNKERYDIVSMQREITAAMDESGESGRLPWRSGERTRQKGCWADGLMSAKSVGAKESLNLTWSGR